MHCHFHTVNREVDHQQLFKAIPVISHKFDRNVFQCILMLLTILLTNIPSGEECWIVDVYIYSFRLLRWETILLKINKIFRCIVAL